MTVDKNPLVAQLLAGGNGCTLKRWRELAPEVEATFKGFKVSLDISTSEIYNSRIVAIIIGGS